MIRTQDIEAEFETQLKKIRDPSIRKKVVETWCKASQGGGWETIEELRDLPFTVVTDAKGIGLLQHTKAATEGAVALAKIQMENMPAFPRVDMDVVVAGALLHDINKVLVLERDGKNGFRKKDGPAEETLSFPGVRTAREAGLPDDIVGLIEYECRNAIGNPNNVEAILVHHSDMTTFDTMNFLKTIASQDDTAGN
jgi:hypothetical protein